MSSSAITGNTSGLASATSPGLVGITTQTFAGKKTFQDGLAFTSASLSDEQATILGLKQYLHGTTYNGGNAPTVTSALAGFAAVRALFIPYQLQDGAWRVRLNLSGTYTLTNFTGTTVTIAGLTFKGIASNVQTLSVQINNAAAANFAFSTVNGTSVISISTNGASNSNTLCIAGDVELNAKPTWAY